MDWYLYLNIGTPVNLMYTNIAECEIFNISQKAIFQLEAYAATMYTKLCL